MIRSRLRAAILAVGLGAAAPAALSMLPVAAPAVHAYPNGCSAWVTGNRGTGYCSASSGWSARLAVACRQGTSITYVYYYRWVSSGGIQNRSCPWHWYPSSAFMQVR